MGELSTTTITVLAFSKVILYLYVGLTAVALLKKAKPRTHLVLITIAVSIFYIAVAYSLKRMWSGNRGDENLVLAFLTQVIHGNPLKDFYYGWLPPFYPPLYFWVTGLIGRALHISTISAAKIGVTLTLLAWFVVPYVLQWWYWKKNTEAGSKIISLPWFWLGVPVLTFLMLDFDAIITKPYEAFSAMLSIVLVGLLSDALRHDQWKLSLYCIFGGVAGLLFLEFYFWWIIILPALVVMALTTDPHKQNIGRVLAVIGILLLIALPYVGSLIIAFAKYGVENWQARYFVPQDFNSFFPWQLGSVRAALALLGVGGLIHGWKEKPFIRIVGLVLITAYVYQAVNILRYLGGSNPMQSSKPFLFLGTACLAVGCSYALARLYMTARARWGEATLCAFVLVSFLLIIPLFPFSSFIDDPKILHQIETSLAKPAGADTAKAIQENIPDYRNNTWLASAVPELAPYLPLSYYIAYSPHFSHQAAQYSRRLHELQELSKAQAPQDFMNLIEGGSPKPIDAMVLYYDAKKDSYPIYLWEDHYPNGGREAQIDIPSKLVTAEYWQKVYSENNWSVWVRK